VPNVTPLRAEDPERIGRHRLTGRISGMPGAGPFYLALAADGTEVTLRLLRGSWTRDGAARDRFAAEAGAARRVAPYCVARILDAGVEGDHAYLASEYVSGPSLLEAVAADGWIGGAELEALAIGSATGLASVHQAGLVHGAFGPDHIILSAAGPRVIEFGITPPYGAATPSADMLAWAQTMAFASLGRPPATLEDLHALPGSLREAVADCLAGDPALRPAAVVIVADLLDDPAPPAGALAEGARRATELYQSVYLPPDDWGGPPSGGQPRDPQAGRQGRHDDGFGDRGDLAGAWPAGPARVAPERAGQSQGAHHHGNHQGTHVQGGHDHAGASRRRGSPASARRSGAWPIAAAFVVIVAVAVVIVHLMQNTGAGSGQAADRTQRSVTQTRSAGGGPGSAPASAAPSPSAKVPAAFAGSWSGQARQLNPADVFDVKVSLAAGASTGSVSYSSASFSCAGELSLQSSAHSVLTLSQGIIRGQRTCANGTVTLSASAGGTLAFSFRGKTGPAASGTLTRS
jgi:eukaryotic-like serine/threonine-protein kinase